MKKILIVEDDFDTQQMYAKAFRAMFPEVEFTQCYMMSEVEQLMPLTEKFDLYILDGQIIGGHTSSFIDLLPKEKTVVISASPEYAKEVASKGIVFINKPFLSSQIREKKEFFETILNK